MAVKFSEVSIAALMAVALAACGGSSDEGGTKEAAADIVEEATEAATEVVEDVEEAATETVADVVEEAEETVAETVEDAVEDVADQADSAVSSVLDQATDAVEDVTETVEEVAEAVADARVSAETIAEYAALTGDAAKGKRVFTRCLSCHVVVEGQNRVGPSLYGIVGRESGSIPGFKYSKANAESGITWTEPTLFAYLENPRQFIPGTIMAFPGLPKAQDRADVIAYLKAESN